MENGELVEALAAFSRMKAEDLSVNVPPNSLVYCGPLEMEQVAAVLSVAVEPGPCERCYRAAATQHICPYKQEVHNENDLCNCCEYCTESCATDI